MSLCYYQSPDTNRWFLIVSSKLKIRRAKHYLSENYLRRWKISTKDDGIQIKKKERQERVFFIIEKQFVRGYCDFSCCNQINNTDM